MMVEFENGVLGLVLVLVLVLVGEERFEKRERKDFVGFFVGNLWRRQGEGLKSDLRACIRVRPSVRACLCEHTLE